MNPYKLRGIVQLIREQGWPPADDGLDVVRDIDSVLAWYGLDRLLTSGERLVVRRELEAVGEAEAFVELIRLKVNKQV